MKTLVIVVLLATVFVAPVFAGWTVTNLSPSGAGANYGSTARGVSGGQQVGGTYLVTDNKNHASLWNGTAASWVNLSPPGAKSSYANGISGGQQVGWAIMVAYQPSHAILWSGTAASWVDLNPPGASGSVASSVSDGQQAGRAIFGGVPYASIWSGTATSWVNLNPTGANRSEVLGISNGQQVGYVTVGGVDRASLWSGTATSWIDLHALLPAGLYASSYAQAIDASDTGIWITGYAYSIAQSRQEAILWYYPTVPEPSSFLTLCGGVAGLLAFRQRRKY